MYQYIKKSDLINSIKERLSDLHAIKKDTIIPEERIRLNKMIKQCNEFLNDIERK